MTAPQAPPAGLAMANQVRRAEQAHAKFLAGAPVGTGGPLPALTIALPRPDLAAVAAGAIRLGRTMPTDLTTVEAAVLAQMAPRRYRRAALVRAPQPAALTARRDAAGRFVGKHRRSP
jgi:hypothetical protein